MVRQYKAVAVETGKEHIGYPVESMRGKIYLIVMFDDYAAEAVRIGYIEVVRETLEMV